MKDIIIMRRSAPKAPIKTYSKRRIEQHPRKRRRLQDLSSSEINLKASFEIPQSETERPTRVIEEDDTIHIASKERRLSDSSASDNSTEGLADYQKSTAQDLQRTTVWKQGLGSSRTTTSQTISDPICGTSIGGTQSTSSLNPNNAVKSSTLENLRDHIHTTLPRDASTNSPPCHQQRLRGPSSQPRSTELLSGTDNQKSSIKNYFKPVEAPSTSIHTQIYSSPSSRSSIPSDPHHPTSTPPSSPHSSSCSPEGVRRKTRKRPRRLQFKMASNTYELYRDMARGEDDDEIQQGYDGGEDLDQHTDSEDRQDTTLSQSDFRNTRGRRDSGNGYEQLGHIEGGANASTQGNFEKGRAFPSSGLTGSSSSRDALRDSVNRRTPSGPIQMPPGRSRATGGNWKKQTTLSYVQNSYLTCKLCDALYIPSLTEDRHIHEEHCKAHTAGKQPTMDTKVLLEKWMDLEGGIHAIMVVDYDSPKVWQEYAYSAIEISYQDLGGPPIQDFKLWTEIRHRKIGVVPRYKVYIYSVKTIVVGIVLAESIEQGGEFYKGEEDFSKKGTLFADADAPRAEAYVSWDNVYPVFVCIDRIWIRPRYRKQGYATTLVDCVRKSFVKAIILSKRQIAFSVPTDVGYEFASSYCRGINYATGTGPSPSAFLVNPKDCPNVKIGGKLEENYADSRK